MKKMLSVVMAALLLLACVPLSPLASADAAVTRPGQLEDGAVQLMEGSTIGTGYCGAEGENLSWTLDDAGTLTITGSGKMADYENRSGASQLTSNDSIIKTVVIEDGVTSIGDWAFSYYKNLASVTIAESVETIGEGAFAGCESLPAVELPTGLTILGAEAFEGCTSLTEVSIPGGVTAIADETFAGCSGLTSVVIPATVTAIGSGAFKDCTSLADVTLPDAITEIADSTFASCASLAEITIPVSVKKIGVSAFSGCSALADVYYDDYQENWDLISIGEDNAPLSNAVIHVKEHEDETLVASGTCGEGLTWELHTDGVLTISGTGAMEDYDATNPAPWTAYLNKLEAAALSSVVIVVGEDDESKEFSFESEDVSVVVENGVTSIGDNAFSGCSNVTSVSLPSTLTSIGEGAFQDCTGLADISIPSGVRSIGAYAFSGSGLTSVVIPDGVTSIAEGTFAGCKELTSVTIPTSVTSIGANAFSGCEALNSVTYLGTEDEWNAIEFADGNEALNEAESKQFAAARYGFCGADEDGQNLKWFLEYNDTTGNGNVLYVEGTGNMQDFTNAAPWYSYRNEITEIVIQEGVTSIGDRAFSGCNNVQHISLPEGLVSIGRSAFYGCSGLSTSNEYDENNNIVKRIVELPDSVKSVGDYAFESCSQITSFKFGKAVEEIGLNPFTHCSSLSEILLEEENESFVLMDKALLSKDGTYLISYPIDDSETEFAVPDGVVRIGPHALCGSRLQIVHIPASVTEIDELAFNFSPKEIYYAGSRADWEKVEIASGNSCLSDESIIHFGDDSYVAYQFVPYSVATGIVGSNFSGEIIVDGLPEGLKFDPETGEISGTPTEEGTFTISFTASQYGDTFQKTITLLVVEAESGQTWADEGYEVDEVYKLPEKIDVSQPQDEPITVKFNVDFSWFKGVLLDNDKLRENVDYRAYAGSVIIVVEQSGLSNQENGTHIFTALFDEPTGNGDEVVQRTSSQSFTIEGSTVGETDNNYYNYTPYVPVATPKPTINLNGTQAWIGELTEAMVNGLLNAGGLTLDLSKEGATVYSLVLSKAQFDMFRAALTTGTMTIKYTSGDVTLDQTVLNVLSGQNVANFEIALTAKTADQLGAAQQSALAGKDVRGLVEVSILTDTAYVESLDGGRITVKVPANTNGNGMESIRELAVRYLPTSGGSVLFSTGYENGYATFRTAHLSTFALCYEQLDMFQDVSLTDWFCPAVDFTGRIGWMNGTGGGYFTPNASFSRAMAVRVIYNMDPETWTGTQSAFSDVQAGDWYYEAVNWAAENGITSGVGNGLFDPEASVTREQFVQFLCNYAKLKGYDVSSRADLAAFPDAAAVSAWAVDSLGWAVKNQIVKGTDTGALNPTGTATRAEAAQILANFQECFGSN